MEILVSNVHQELPPVKLQLLLNVQKDISYKLEFVLHVLTLMLIHAQLPLQEKPSDVKRVIS
jgi:hypothetical protein